MTDLEIVDLFEKLFMNNILPKDQRHAQLVGLAEKVSDPRVRTKLSEAANSLDLSPDQTVQQLYVARRLAQS